MSEPAVFIVDDDAGVRDSLCTLLESLTFRAEAFDSARAFLDAYTASMPGCLIADIRMPDMDGLQLQQELTARGLALPVIVVTGHGDVPLAVRAMKAGAVDFLEKPFDEKTLLAAVRRALSLAAEQSERLALAEEAQRLVAGLTKRERDVLDHLVEGKANKVIAHELGISPRTVEIHRSNLMDKMKARSLADLVQKALQAGAKPGDS